MRICPVSKENSDHESGENLLWLTKKECQLMVDVFEDYCKRNKRKKLAHKFLNTINKYLGCW